MSATIDHCVYSSGVFRSRSQPFGISNVSNQVLGQTYAFIPAGNRLCHHDIGGCAYETRRRRPVVRPPRHAAATVRCRSRLGALVMTQSDYHRPSAISERFDDNQCPSHHAAYSAAVAQPHPCLPALTTAMVLSACFTSATVAKSASVLVRKSHGQAILQAWPLPDRYGLHNRENRGRSSKPFSCMPSASAAMPKAFIPMAAYLAFHVLPDFPSGAAAALANPRGMAMRLSLSQRQIPWCGHRHVNHGPWVQQSWCHASAVSDAISPVVNKAAANPFAIF